jgi:hypothetical protein
MQSWKAALTAVAVGVMTGPAHATDAATWATMAARFGCTKLANEQHAKDDSFYMAQYIPSSEKPKNWTRIFTVQLFRAPADIKQSNQYIEGLIRQIPKNIEATKGGDVTVWQAGEGKDGPVAYGEFSIGGENTVSVVYRAAKGVVAVNQFAVRKARLGENEKLLLKQLVATEAPSAPAYPKTRH